MSKEIFPFRMDLKIRNFQCEASAITASLGIPASFTAAKGQKVGTITHKRSHWAGRFREGEHEEVFVTALEDFLALLEGSAAFFEQRSSEGAEIVLAIGLRATLQDDGILCWLQLEPFFLQACGQHGIGLRVEAWAPKPEDLEVKALGKEAAL